jgi:hypothetical protein
MAYEVEAIETMKEKVVDPRSKKSKVENSTAYAWWTAQDDNTLLAQVLSTTAYLKRTNFTRIRQASIFSRLYCGKPLSNFLASNSTLDSSNQLPIGRPTANVCYSCTDTLVSMISQNRPLPTFLTDGGNYKERKVAEEANQFLQGEFFRTDAYELATKALTDSCVLGDGFVKVYPDFSTDKVVLERVIETELLTDFNDAYYGNPRQLIHQKLVDRSVMRAYFPKKQKEIDASQQGNVDATPRSTETVSDQFIVAEAWHLPSNPDAKDGRHVIACAGGILLDEVWERDEFPFVKIGYNPNMVGWYSQGLLEILMPTQMEIYRNLIVASQAIELMGVPRIYMDRMSKIVETSFNNRIGTIIKGTGPPPQFINATSNDPEIYQWIQWLIENAYQMSGISSMAAQAKKSSGLNSGEAIREANDLQSARFASLERRYQNFFVHLGYHILTNASEIVKKNGEYSTVYPGKDGTREVDFKSIGKLNDNYVIQCFEQNSLPKDPAGRQAKLSEMLAAGEINSQEFRRLSNFPDLQQSDRLASALENRILHALDHIVDHGEKDFVDIAPDAFMLDPTDMATTLCVNYINLYSTCGLEEEKMQVLRDWFTQVQVLKQKAAPPPMQMPAPAQKALPVQPPAPSVAPTSNVQV